MSEAFIELCELIRQAGLELRLYGRPVTKQQVLEYAQQHSMMRIATMSNSNTDTNWKFSDELDGLKLGTAEEERHRAKLWMDTAAQHGRNEEYWRNRCRKAEEVINEFVKQAGKAGYTISAKSDD
jgi:hypothetical protein